MNAVFVTRTKLSGTRLSLPARPVLHAWPAWLIVAGTLIRIPQLWHGLNEQHSFRQTQTAYVALEFARHGINPLRTPLPVFGPQADVPMDFPLVQALAAVLIRMGATADWAVRTVGLVGFQAAAILLAVLVSRWHCTNSRRSGWHGARPRSSSSRPWRSPSAWWSAWTAGFAPVRMSAC